MKLAGSMHGGWLLLVAAIFPVAAQAFVVDIDNGPPRTVYLRVGDGSFTGTYDNGGTPLANGTINTVSVDVPADQVGNGVSQAMAGDGRLTSDYDGFAFCNAGEVYVGGFYRTPNPGSTPRYFSVTVTSQPNLVNASGDTIPMSQISWTTSGIGDAPGTQPFGNGSTAFTGGTQALTVAFERNTWRESCFAFRYANSAIVPAGSYTATVTYTLATP